MKLKWTPKLALTTAAALAATAAACMTAANIRAASGYSRRLNARRAELDRVRTLGLAIRENRTVIKIFEEAAAAEQPTLEGIVTNALAGVAHEMRETGSGMLADGWRIRQTEIVIKAARLELLGALAAQLEAATPPWRAVEIGITASAPEGGVGHARLVAERIEPQK